MVPFFAFLIDLLLGDPSNRFHPTAWMGSLIAWWGRFRPRGKPAAEFLSGTALILLGIILTGAVGYAWTRLCNLFPIPFNWLAIALFLKTTISLRGLNRAAREVQTALESNDLPEARRLLSWHLVSRDTSGLSEGQVAGAAIESVAENATDGILAPLFFFAVGGLPAALAYRFVNTADAMIGYHDPEHEWYGKFAARLDDVLNLIPARLTGLFILAASFLMRQKPVQAWRTMRSDAHLTASPNAGVTMSAMAGALGVKLEKVEQYTLGGNFPAPAAVHLQRARQILLVAVILAVAVLMPIPAANWVR